MDQETHLGSSTLAEIYPKYSAPDGGGDKGTAHSYIEIYEAEMTKKSNIRLLEIGVWEGQSLAMWQEYFKDSDIWGIDVDMSKVKYRVNAIYADATKPIKLNLMEFNYIIDDGSHRVHDQLTSLTLLWHNLLSKGKYFIEDIQGIEALEQIETYLKGRGFQYRVYDNRAVKNRADDIMVVIEKE